jgi:tryptophan synthase alpha chain
MLGFGISTPVHVKHTLALGADGAIVGSAIVAKVTEGGSDLKKLCEDLRAYVAEMKAATGLVS